MRLFAREVLPALRALEPGTVPAAAAPRPERGVSVGLLGS
jgi:hypothetical protein